ncbi:ABC-type multidrug transport system ATPase subunit [Paenibacillus sp. PastF-3]|uniref:hypothetical protein n=1 Tax=unclassified Paenibacillus TaxID=185978 RepID=UPI002475F822|nr:hypothetical protein [Paenibacillus sp. PastF-3]MDH6368892.1 ABC-type multidrug transport system ATPase subunit [Paenibacillus sp. PastF-3]
MRSQHLSQRAESGNTVFLSIHLMEELAATATVDDVVIIKHGTIVADGTLEKQKVTLSRWRTPFCSYCSF